MSIVQSHYEALAVRYAELRAAFDEAAQAGVTLPPSTGQAMAQLGITVMSVRAAETGQQPTLEVAEYLLGGMGTDKE